MLPRLSDGVYDLVFCDCDPVDYPEYLAAATRLLRPGGVVAFNNALGDFGAGGHGAGGHGAGGDVRSASDDLDSDSESRAGGFDVDLASMVRDDERLVPMLLPLSDGLLAAVLRGN